jgi:uncharacterized protein YuzE
MKSSKPIINYDSKADVLYILASEGKEEEFVELGQGINVELDQNRKVIGIEILNASKIIKPVLLDLQKKVVA